MISVKKTRTGAIGLTLGALGVVFGDIGTSPLYAVRVIFGPLGHHLTLNQPTIYGIISLIFWTIMLVVSVKYLGFIMRASNKGEGGIMALVALIKSSSLRRKRFFIVLGLVGVALFYGDSAITPAISVLSAVEGLKIIAPSLESFVIPVTLVILTVLFWIQKYGTALIGRLFGPVMLLWFVTIGLGGGWQVWQHPDILHALSPLAAIDFITANTLGAFIAMGAVVLAITGAEALYADMGHFGRAPIGRAWFLLVLPALTLCYMGQGALLLHDPHATLNPFFLLFPASAHIPVVLLATIATLIASQSVISGAFSLTRQAVQLGFLPRMMIYQTSAREIGQIYIPFVNIALFVVVTLLVLFFGSSVRLANAYGVAVSGTLAADTILFLAVMRGFWHASWARVALIGVLFLSVDLVLISSNASKILHGGWLPLTVAALVLVLVNTWLKGHQITSKERVALEGPLQDFISMLHGSDSPSIARLPGQAVYIGHHEGLTPLALHTAVEDLHELHEKVTIVYVQTSTEAHVPEDKRAVFNDLGYTDGISQVTLSYGFHDLPNIPKTLKSLRHLSPELDFDPYHASYFISLTKVVPSKRRNLARWRKSLYSLMSRNSLSASDYYQLPIDRTVEMRALIKL
ncbi:MAG: potassium transporter Kup [Candidatus Saccharibacteria bacterium]|nr:potassium transporter Kup [Candidatus Saccharibacteria bacterium]